MLLGQNFIGLPGAELPNSLRLGVKKKKEIKKPSEIFKNANTFEKFRPNLNSSERHGVCSLFHFI